MDGEVIGGYRIQNLLQTGQSSQVYEVVEVTSMRHFAMKLLLPEQRELTIVLQNVQDRARGRLTLTKFAPMEEVQQDFYTGKPVSVEVTGSYNNLGQFFAQMASYQRIVSITDFKVTTREHKKDEDISKANQTVEAEFLVTAYYVPPEKLQAPADKKGKGNKGGKGKDAKAAKAESAD